MHHPRAEELDPSVPAHGAAGAVAEEARHAHLRAGLDEREVRGTEADAALLTEQSSRHRLEGALQVREGDPFIHDERLHLVEDRQVRGVGRLATVDAPRRDDVHGWRLRLHRSYLDRARLRAEEQFGMAGDRHVQGVLHGPRGMVLGDVQRLEVVPVVLDLRPLDDAEPQTEEHVDDLILHDRERMERARGRTAPRQGEIDEVVHQEGSGRLTGQPVARLLERGSEDLPGLVDLLAQRPALVLGEGAQAALHLAEGGPASHHRGLRRLEIVQRGRRAGQLETARSFRLQRAAHLGDPHGCASLATASGATGSPRTASGGPAERAPDQVHGVREGSTWNESTPSFTSAHARPPWASATPRAT